MSQDESRLDRIGNALREQGLTLDEGIAGLSRAESLVHHGA